MLKKQMLLMFMAGCMVSGTFAAEQQSITAEDNNTESESFKLAVYESDVRHNLIDGIPCTDKVNGVEVWELLNTHKKINPEGISVVEYEDDNFSELNEFSRQGLRSCNFALGLYGEKHVKGVYQPKYVSLTKSLRDKTCYLCINGNKQIIVTHAQGTPQEVCAKTNQVFQRKIKVAQMQEQANKNARMSAQASRKAKEQRDATGK